MRFYKTGLLMMTCLLATPALAVEVVELPGYSQMTVSDEFKTFLEKDSELTKKLANDAPLSRLVMSRAILQQQLMKKELTIKDIEATYFPNRDVTAEDVKAAESRGGSTSASDTSAAHARSGGGGSPAASAASGIINNAISAARSPQAQARSRQQIAALDLNNPQKQQSAMMMASAESSAAAGGGAGGDAPYAAAGYATYEPEPAKDARDYEAMFTKLKEIVGPSSWLRLPARPTGDPKYDSYTSGIDIMRNGEDLKRVTWTSALTILDRLIKPQAATIDGQQLLALLKAAQHTPDDLATLMKNPIIVKKLADMKVKADTLFPVTETKSSTEGRIIDDLSETELDARGWPKYLNVPDVCPLPQTAMRLPQNPSSRSAIYNSQTDPAEHIVHAIPLGNANGYSMQQMTAYSPAYNSGLVNEITYAYCPGDFTGITPEGMPAMKPICLDLDPTMDAKYMTLSAQQHCLVPNYPSYEAGHYRFMNVRSRNMTLPPYVGPCLSEGPYPANYSENTCGQTQAAVNGSCSAATETYSCYDSQNELPPQTFSRKCENGTWRWTQGYLTPASSRFRCEAVYTTTAGTEVSYATPDFDSAKIGVKTGATYPGDMACAAHREGQIRETQCGWGQYMVEGPTAENVGFSYAQQCQFNKDKGQYAWATTSLSTLRTEGNAHLYGTCYTRVVEKAPAVGCTITGRFSKIDVLPPASPSFKAGHPNLYRTAGENETFPIGTRIVLRHSVSAQGDGDTTDFATYECKAASEAINSKVDMLPSFQNIKGERLIQAVSEGNTGYFLNVYIEMPK